MNNLYDVLEICLQELENGADLETVLARYPDLAGELRPILKASIQARMRSEFVSTPSPDVIRRGRAKLLQHASEMREAKAAPRKRMIPVFQRLAISFALTALFLASGTGLVSASSSALPGENLYPVKLTWENLRLFFTFNPEYRENLEHAFENERLHEVNELLVEGLHETIQFTGIYMEVNGVKYVSGVPIVILDTSILPVDPLLNGMAVIVTGHTNAQRFVEVESIALLPAGSIVPTGESPVEVGHDDNNNSSGNENFNDNDSNDVEVNDNVDNDSNDTNNNTNNDDNVNNDGNDNGDSNSNDDGDSNDDSNDSGDSNSNDNGDSNDNNADNDDDSSGGGGNDDNSGSGGGDNDNSDSDNNNDD